MKVVDQTGSVERVLVKLGFTMSNDLNEASTEENTQGKIVVGTTRELKKISEKILNSALGVIIFGSEDGIKGKVLAHYPEKLTEEKDQISLKNLINTLSLLRDEKEKEGLVASKLYERLLEIDRNTESHSKNLRKINRALVPKRFLNTNGIELAARYTPGNRMSSEYYDAHFIGTEGIIFIITSSSYLLSTIAISLFSEMKNTCENINEFYHTYLNTLLDEKDKLGGINRLSFSLLKIDSRELKLTGFNSGKQLIGDENEINYAEDGNFTKNNITKENVNFKLESNRYYIIGSQGLARQMGESDNFSLIKEIIKKYNTAQDIADEISLKIDVNDNGFLEWDASVLVLEATKNALYSI